MADTIRKEAQQRLKLNHEQKTAKFVLFVAVAKWKDTVMKNLLNFEPVPETYPQTWTAKSEKYAFKITRSNKLGENLGFLDYFVQHASRLDGTHSCRIGRAQRSFDAAVRLCSRFTRDFRRQIAYHEAGHAVAARLFGLEVNQHLHAHPRWPFPRLHGTRY